MGSMLPYIAAPWILWDTLHRFDSASHPYTYTILYCIILSHLSLSHEQQSWALDVYHTKRLRFVKKRPWFTFKSTQDQLSSPAAWSMLRFAHGWRRRGARCGCAGCAGCALLAMALPGRTTSLSRWSSSQQCRALCGVALVRGLGMGHGEHSKLTPKDEPFWRVSDVGCSHHLPTLHKW